MLRPESITRCAASILYSAVNRRRLPDIETSFQQAEQTCLIGVYFCWGASTGVKAKPYGRPPAGLDPGIGHNPEAATETDQT